MTVIDRRMIYLKSIGTVVDEALVFYPLNTNLGPDRRMNPKGAVEFMDVDQSLFERMSYGDREFLEGFMLGLE